MRDQAYLAVFTSDKTGPKWRAWRAMTEAQQAERAERGVAAVHAWNAANRDVILYQGGPLGPRPDASTTQAR